MKAYWTTLSHKGVSFPDEYTPDALSIKIQGKPVSLSPLAEEMAYNLAKKKDTPYIQDPVFTANFMADFVKQLPDWCRRAKYEDADFSELFAKVDREKAAKEGMGKEEKRAQAAGRKEIREALKKEYGFAVIDGKQVEFANYMVEPPGLFMGRGRHPYRGKWKPRIRPQDVILNLDKSTKVPGAWKKVVHDHGSMWMAKWVDKLTEKEKYVWLHESSHIQQSRSKAKYDNAAKVGASMKKIEARIEKELSSKDPKMRQVATVCYLIHKLGMRVGDEKDEDEADTVGASTLRVEHVRLRDNIVEFSFLGKDSVVGESELYYRLNGSTYYSNMQRMAEMVPYQRIRTDSFGRVVGVPAGLVEVLTTDDLNQKRAKIAWGRVTAIISHDVEGPIFEVLTAGRRRIVVTGDHSLFRRESRGSCNAKDAPVSEMTEEDSLATISRLPIQQQDLKSFESVPITDDLLTFAGLWLADGCYYPKGIIISAGGDQGIDAFVEQFSQSFRDGMRDEIRGIIEAPLPGSVRANYRRGRATTVLSILDRRGTAFSHKMNKKGDIWCRSTALKGMLERLGLTGDSSTKRIPDWLFTASDRQIASFLKGYFSGDGSFGIYTTTAVSASSINLRLLEHTRVLLLRLCIDCTISETTNHSGFPRITSQWILAIKRKDSIRRFFSLVGFLPRKGNNQIILPKTRYNRYPIAWRKIRSVRRVALGGRVFDLSVEGTERFVVDGILAHNSVQWNKKDKPPPAVIRNLQEFTAGKKPDTEIFHDVTSSMVNQFLSSIVPGLSAKVFRTWHATARAKQALESKSVEGMDDIDKLYFAKEANLKAAEFCNHQRTLPKTWEQSYEKKKQKLDEVKAKGKKDDKRLKKLEMELDFYVRTKNYNLNTSLKNYIDPRVYKKWCDQVGLDWAKIYSKSLQRKFSWVAGSKPEQQGKAIPPVATSR